MRLIHRNGNIHEDEELFLDDRFTLSEAKQNRREEKPRFAARVTRSRTSVAFIMAESEKTDETHS